MTESKGAQRTGKQICYFMTKQEFDACNDDVIKILLPKGNYCARNLNFLNCFLNNTPPKEQEFVLHWSKDRIPRKAFELDVFEIITVQLTKEGGEREVHYLMPVPVLLEILGISRDEFPMSMFEQEERSRDLWDTREERAIERKKAYDRVLGNYCKENDIAFHPIQKYVKRDKAYMKQMEI